MILNLHDFSNIGRANEDTKNIFSTYFSFSGV